MTSKEYPCSPASWKGRIPWMFRVSVPQFCFRSACEWHDHMYLRGGTEETRREVDLMFLWFMESKIREKKPMAKRLWYLAWARCYYLAVRHYGKAHFNHQMRITDE